MHPILFKLGPVTIYSYGALVALAFCVTSYLIIRDSPGYGIPRNKIWDLLLYILISGIIGARLLHVLLHFEYYKDGPLKIIMLHRGGLAIHGAIIASIFVSIFFLLKNRLPLWETGDLIMQYLPLGQAIGRIGCFFNGCCYGKPTLYFLGVTFPGEFQTRHPAQIYSSAALLIIFVILRRISKKANHFNGEVFLIYFLIFLPVRFFIDFLRGDLTLVLGGLTTSQLINVSLFVIAGLTYYIRVRYIRRK